jgi:hypothetical protein
MEDCRRPTVDKSPGAPADQISGLLIDCFSTLCTYVLLPPQDRKHQMREIANQQTHNDSSWCDDKCADPNAKTHAQRHTKASNRDQSKNARLEPVALRIDRVIPASITEKAEQSNYKHGRRAHPREQVLAADALDKHRRVSHSIHNAHRSAQDISYDRARDPLTMNSLIQSTRFSTSGTITSSHRAK